MAFVSADRPRFEILDGLRGVAAIIVVAFHIFEAYSPGPALQIINHGYLAVDFFFALSGYVIGYAYDDRWSRGMTVGGFMLRRVVRLHPMVIMGALFGFLTFYLSAGAVSPAVASTPLLTLSVVFLLTCLLIPAPSGLDIRGWGESYSLDGPMWSLMFEYIGNLLYALFVRRFPCWLLALFVAISAALTIDVALDIDLFNILEARSYHIYTIIGGWSLNADQLYIGSVRLLYPFFCGLLVYRLGLRIKLRGAFLWCSAGVVALLSLPRIGYGDTAWHNGLYEAVAILVLFPVIVMAGAGSKIRGPRQIALCRWLGAVSYPLYLIHYPLIYLYFDWQRGHASLPLQIHVFTGVSVLLLSVAMAWGVLRLYDIPVRRFLTSAWLKKTEIGRRGL